MALIAVIDDDPDIREASSLVLNSKGYDVITASNPKDGYTIVKEKNPDLIILDVMMEEPDDGIALSRDLRKKGFSKPIIMLTSLGKVTGFNYGKDDSLIPVDVFHEKPIAPDKLISTIKQLLQGR